MQVKGNIIRRSNRSCLVRDFRTIFLRSFNQLGVGTHDFGLCRLSCLPYRGGGSLWRWSWSLSKTRDVLEKQLNVIITVNKSVAGRATEDMTGWGQLVSNERTYKSHCSLSAKVLKYSTNDTWAAHPTSRLCVSNTELFHVQLFSYLQLFEISLQDSVLPLRLGLHLPFLIKLIAMA